MSTDTLAPTETDTSIDEAFRSILDNEDQVKDQDSDAGDHDRLSHYVRKEDIIASSMTGAPVFALCGKKWTPNKNPEKYPVCPECKDVYEGLSE